MNVFQAHKIELFIAVYAQRFGAVGVLELQRQYAHANEVATVYALEAPGNDRLDAEQLRSLGSPVAARSRSVLFSPEYHCRYTVCKVSHGCIVDAHLLPIGLVQGDAAFAAGYHEVFDANIRESATHHHIMVAPTRPIAIEIGFGYPVRKQIFSSG